MHVLRDQCRASGVALGVGRGRPADRPWTKRGSAPAIWGNGFSRFKKTQNQSERGPDVLTLRFRELEPRERLREGGRERPRRGEQARGAGAGNQSGAR